MLGFGAPALGLSYVPTSVIFWGIVSLVLIYSAYVSEVYRAGIESIHPSQEAPRARSACRAAQTLRRVILPQAVRRVIPPLLNDFIGLQKDTALVGTLGAIEAFQQSQIDANATFNFTAVSRGGRAVRRDHDPARAVHRLARSPRDRRQRQAGGDTVTRPLAVEGSPSRSASTRCCAHRSRRSREHEVVALIGASGSGKSTLLRCINLLEPINARAHLPRGEEITRDARRQRGPPPDRDRLPVVQSVPAHERAAQRDARAARRPRPVEARGRRAGAPRCSSASGSPTSATSIPTGSPAASSSASQSSGRSPCSPS